MSFYNKDCPNRQYFLLWDANQELIKSYVEVDEPRSEYNDDEKMKCILTDQPYYEYPGIKLPAYLKLTDHGIEVYSGKKIGRISKSCEEYVRDVFLFCEYRCQVALGGGMCANLINGEIYRDFDEYFAILELAHWYPR